MHGGRKCTAKLASMANVRGTERWKKRKQIALEIGGCRHERDRQM